MDVRRSGALPAANEPPPPPPHFETSFGEPPAPADARTPGAGIIGAAGALIVLCLVAAGIVVLTRERSGAPDGTARVDVIGDSLVHQAQVPIERALAGAGYRAVVAGMPSQSLASLSVRSRLEVVSGAGGQVIVLATTANDVRSNAAVDGQHPSAPAYHDDIVALLSRFADRCVVVVNARDLVNAVFLPERAVVLNTELEQLGRRQPNLVVVDWANLSREMPASSFAPDQLHFGEPVEAEQPDSPSARSYADAIVEGVRRCPERD